MYGGGFDGGGMGGGFDVGGMGGGFDQGGQGQFGGGFGGNADAFGGHQFQGASQGGDGGFQVDNSGPDGKAKKNNQSLIPVTIKQLKNAPTGASGDGSFAVDGHELHQVTICGVIMQADEQNTNLQYKIDDGTDDIIVKMWIDTDADEAMIERRAQWKEGKLVRVVGQLRIFNHSRSVVAFNIQPITDYNEYTYHFIEVVHSHLRHTKGQPPAGGMTGAAAAGTSYGAGTSYTGMQGNGVQNAGFAAAPPPRGVSVQETVRNYFRDYGNASESGCTVNECWDAMKAQGVTVGEIRDAVEMLVTEGLLYSTVDDDHYKSTE